MTYDTTLTNFFEKVAMEDMTKTVNPLLPEDISETSRYVLSWTDKAEHINLVTFLWDSKIKMWKNITCRSRDKKERYKYFPRELAMSGMQIVEKVPMDFFLHDKKLLWGEIDVGYDAGNW